MKAYGITRGKYIGKRLCYDCCKEIIEQDIEKLTCSRDKIKRQFILQIVGMAFGAIIGLSLGVGSGDAGLMLFMALAFACIGGMFLSALKAFGSLTWEAIQITFDKKFGVLTIFQYYLTQLSHQ